MLFFIRDSLCFVEYASTVNKNELNACVDRKQIFVGFPDILYSR